MKTVIGFFVLLSLVAGIFSCRESQPFTEEKMDQRMSGGMHYTIFDASSNAFSTMIPGMNGRDAFVHELGDDLFEAQFVSAPAPVNPGLGPIFNNTSCINCHQRDGRGRPPMSGEKIRAMLFRISIPGKDEYGGAKPVPGYGTQLQDKAIAGASPEAEEKISYTTKEVKLHDGTAIQLRVPHYEIYNAYYPLPSNLLISPRIAAQTVGVGLINAIPENQILQNADPEDENGDGISGRPNWVYDHTSKMKKLGRFGWKANVASLSDQVAGAFQQDMGISNYIFPEESSKGQEQFPTQGNTGVNIEDSLLDATIFYLKTLAVPARRNVNDPLIRSGAAIFSQIGCEACHKSTFTTTVDVAFRPLSNQVIHPYSDFLLHDMGTELGDGRPDFEATGNEWRTAPLWGIGLTEKVTGYAFYLHDGRAQTLTEAILWHGGEANQSKDAFKKLDKADRNALIRFLETL